jgi:hypothetical protein
MEHRISELARGQSSSLANAVTSAMLLILSGIYRVSENATAIARRIHTTTRRKKR